MPVCAICRSLLSMEGLCIGVYKKKNYNLDDSTEMIEKKPKSIITYGHALRTSQIWKRSWGGGGVPRRKQIFRYGHYVPYDVRN